jgi:cytidyltransferase-like protein
VRNVIHEREQGGEPKRVVVSGSFDDIRSGDVRFLQEAARIGPVYLRLWSDALVASTQGKPPVFLEAERRFVTGALRYVAGVSLVQSRSSILRPVAGVRPDVVVVRPNEDDPGQRAACARLGVEYFVPDASSLSGFPPCELSDPDASARRVVVTGCFDWLHSGHLEFFHEAAAFGDLYVVVGSDRNLRYLKGDGHPLHGQDERHYMVQAAKDVHRALISTGSGWMDAEPEIASIAPHFYVVNEDGDQPVKRDFCRAHGLEYVVLRRRPHRGLPKRTSTSFRGF